jgi:hypothetical protein
MLKDDLIKMLQEIPGNPEVYMDVDEVQSDACSVCLIKNKKEEPYSKLDKPSAFGAGFPYILISG